jgi:RHS repeat-associated protein
VYVVTTLADEFFFNNADNNLSLREALHRAATDGSTTDNDVIRFDSALFANGPAAITLTYDSSDNGTVPDRLDINSSVTIDGPGGNFLIVNGATQTQVFRIASDVTATVEGVWIVGGYSGANGGGVEVAGDLTLKNVTITSNRAVNFGGGIYVAATGTLTLLDSTVDNNQSDFGGGIGGHFGAGERLRISGSTVSNNRAFGTGAGLNFFGPTAGTASIGRIVNSTFSNNTAGADGTGASGGIRVRSALSEVTIVNSTIADNTAGQGAGIQMIDSPKLTLFNTIVADNTTNTGTASNVLGANFQTASSNNFVGPGGGFGGLNPSTNTLISSGFTGIGPLADYGGSVRTHGLLIGSPAIDKGDTVRALGLDNSFLPSDQRGDGFSRFVDGDTTPGMVVDIGAYEAGSARIVVDTVADESNSDYSPGHLSLREAIALAASLPGHDVITFSASVFNQPRTITLNSLYGQLLVNSDVDIVGPGAKLLTVDANSDAINKQRVFNIGSLATAKISGMTITGGDADYDSGGGIYSVGDLSLDRVTVTGNTAEYGGGLYQSGGPLSITNSTFWGNTALSVGAAYVETSELLRIEGSTFRNNSTTWMGAVFSSYTDTDIRNSTFSTNSASGGYGAGLRLWGPSGMAALLTNVTVANNDAGTGTRGGIFVGGGLTPILRNTVVADNTRSSGTVRDDVGGPFNPTSAHNFISVIDGSTGLDTAGSNSQWGTLAVPGFARLSQLGQHGGPTETRVPLPLSPLINAGSNAHIAGLYSDQRGEGFPRVISGVDIGATEFEGIPQQLVVNTLVDAHYATAIGDGIVDIDLITPGRQVSLRAAIQEINTLSVLQPQTYVIAFDPSLAGKINIGSLGQITIAADVRIEGTGRERLTIDGQNMTRLFVIGGAADVEFRSLRLTGGRAASNHGGAIYDDGTTGTTILDSVTVEANQADLSGGGIYALGTLEIRNSEFIGNTARSGGALFSDVTNSAQVTIEGTRFYANTAWRSAGTGGDGGAVFITSTNATTAGVIKVTNSTFESNSGTSGAAIRQNAGTLDVTDGEFLRNSATHTDVANGGAIYSTSTLNIKDSLFSLNTSDESGGGIYSFGGFLTVNSSTFTHNQAYGLYGGAVYYSGALIGVNDSNIANNRAGQHGGGIYTNSAIGHMARLTMRENTAVAQGGAIYTAAALSLEASDLIANKADMGGAIFVASGSSPTITKSELVENVARAGGGIYAALGAGRALTVRESTIAKNSAVNTAGINGSGGGINIDAAGGTATFTNTTISGNTSQVAGGVHILSTGTTANVTFTNSTIAYNTGGTQTAANSAMTGGVAAGGVASVTLHNSIVAENRRADLNAESDISGSATQFSSSSSYNIIGITPGNLFLTTVHNQVGVAEPKLLPLGDYGGPTQTHALLFDSPAVDRGNAITATNAGLTTDQRGLKRDVDAPAGNGPGGVVDIGAVEFTLVVVATADFNGDGRTDQLAYDTPTRSLLVVLGTDGGSMASVWGTLNSGLWSNFLVGDFNGDGRDDIVARNTFNAANSLTVAISQGNKFLLYVPTDSVTSTSLAAPWTETFIGNFDNDASDEILGWFPGSSDTSRVANRWEVLQYSDHGGFIFDSRSQDWGNAIRSDAANGAITVGDVDRDGRDDIVAYNTTSGTWKVGLSQIVSGISRFVLRDFENWFNGYVTGAPASGVVDVDGPYRKLIDNFAEIYNTIELELYAGFMKGWKATEETKAANAWEQASLLVRRLENLGFTAANVEIASGYVKVPFAALFDWLGLDGLGVLSKYNAFQIIRGALDGFAAPLNAAGADVRVPTDAGNDWLRITNDAQFISFRHAWVRVKVPRAGGLEFVDIDPSWKFKDRQAGHYIDLSNLASSASPIAGRPARGSFDEFGFLATAPDNQLPLEWYEDQLMKHFMATGQNVSLAQIAYDGPIKQKQFKKISDAFGVGNYLNGPVMTYPNFDEIVANSTWRQQLTHRMSLTATIGDTDEFVARTYSLDGINALPEYAGLQPTGVTDVTFSPGSISSYGMQPGPVRGVAGTAWNLRETGNFPSMFYGQPGPLPPFPGFDRFISGDYTNSSGIDNNDIWFEKASARGIELTMSPTYVFTPNTWVDFEIGQTHKPGFAGSYNPTVAVGVVRYTADANPRPVSYSLYRIDGAGYSLYADGHSVNVTPSSGFLSVSIPAGAFASDNPSQYTTRIYILHSDNIIRGLRESGNQTAHNGGGRTIIRDLRLREEIPYQYTLNGDELQLTGNSLVTANTNYNIGPNTTLQFDFRSTNEGEFHIIGWDTDDIPGDAPGGEDASALLGIYGHQILQSDYTNEGSYQTLRLQLDPAFSGTSPINVQNLVFGVNGASNPNANSYFRSVKLYESKTELVGSGTNRAIKLTGDAFKRLELSSTYTITPRTYLEFDVNITSQGRFHGIGWDSDNDRDFSESGNQIYWLGGTNPNDYSPYLNIPGIQPPTGQKRTVRINIGAYLSGTSFPTMRNLVFINDNGSAEYSNFKIGEDDQPSNQFWNREFVTAKPEGNVTTDTIQFGYNRTDRNGVPTYRSFLEVNGTQVIQSDFDKFLYPGETTRFDTHHLYPTLFATAGDLANYNLPQRYEREAGEVHALVLDANQYSREYIVGLQSALNQQQATLFQQRVDGNLPSYATSVDAIGNLLSYTGAKYWYDFNNYSNAIDGYFRAIGTQPRVGSGLVSSESAFINDAQSVTHLNFPNVPQGMGVDFPNWAHASYDARGNYFGISREALQLLGYNASSLENAVIEEVVNTSSISTMRGLLRAYDDQRGRTSTGGIIEREAVQVFESVPGAPGSLPTIYFRGEIGSNVTTPFNPNGGTIFTRAQLLNLTTGLLKNHVRPGQDINVSHADAMVDFLENAGGDAVGTIRILVPRSRSVLETWTGSVYVGEYQTAGGLLAVYKIGSDTGPLTNGAFGTDRFRPENTFLSKGTYLNQTWAGDPVNIANGNMFRDEVDFRFPNGNLPLDFGRHYDSQNPMDVGFGVGWTHSFTGILYMDPEDQASTVAPTKITWLRADGQRHTFTRPDASSPWKVPASLFGTFDGPSAATGNRYRFLDKDGTQYFFALPPSNFRADGIANDHSSANDFNILVVGRLTEINYRGNDKIAIQYENTTSVRVTQVADTLTNLRRLDVAYPTSTSATVTKWENNAQISTWIYGFTSYTGTSGYSTRWSGYRSKRLIVAISPADSALSIPSSITQYEYYIDGPDSRRGLIKKIIEPNASEWHEYEYYSNGRVFQVKTRVGDGPTASPTDDVFSIQAFNYNLFRNLTEFTDERWNVETYIHQDNGLLLKQIHPDRSRVEYTWGNQNATSTADDHEEFLMLTSTDELGAKEQFFYYQPTGDPHTYRPVAQQNIYRPGELKRSISKDNITTDYQYWVSTSTTFPEFQRISELSKVIVDPTGQQLTTNYLERDERGNLKRLINAVGNETQFEYFDYSTTTPPQLRGKLKSKTDPKGVTGNEAVAWETLTERFTITGNTLSVRLLTGPVAGQQVVADAIRIDRIDEDGVYTRIVDNDISGSPSFRFTPVGGTGTYWESSGHSQVEYAGDALVLDGSSTVQGSATWIFTDLLPGTYRISATWIYDPTTRDPNARYQFYSGLPDGSIEGSATGISHRTAPNDFRSFQIVYQYDTAGNTVSAISEGLPSGRRSYDSHGNVVYEEDASGTATINQFDVQGRLAKTAVVDPKAFNFATYTAYSPLYDVQPSSWQSQNLGNTLYLFGNTRKAFALNYQVSADTVLEFDFEAPVTGEYYGISFGNSLSQNDILGIHLAGTDPTNYGGWTRAYDGYQIGTGRRHYRIPLGQHLAAGTYNYITFVNADTLSPNGPVQGQSYFSNVRIYETTGPTEVSTTKYTYDANGRVKTTTDALGRTVTNSYDARGKLVRQDLPDGTFLTHAYDLLGNCIGITDELGRTTRFRYDDRNRLIETIYADGTSTRTRYDGVGNVVASIDELGRVTNMTYDKSGRLLTTSRKLEFPDTTPTNLTEFNIYDPLGRLAFQFDANLNVTEYQYDRLGRVILTRVLDNQSTTLPPLHLSTTSYDANGNPFRTVEYDAGRLLTPVAQGGAGLTSIPSDPTTLIATLGNSPFLQVTETKFDAFDRVVEMVYADGNVASTIYDAAGRVRFTTDELGRKTESRYDQFGRLQRIISPDPDRSNSGQESAATRFVRDAVGNVIEEWQYFGVYEARSGVEHANRYIYDRRNRVVTTLMKDNQHRTDVLFDKVGHVVATTDALANTTYNKYDERGRVIETRLPDPDGTTGVGKAPITRNVYDRVGNVESTTDPLGNITFYAYDSFNRLRKESHYHTVIADDSDTPSDTSFVASGGGITFDSDSLEVYGRDLTFWNPGSSRQATWTFTALETGSYRAAMTWYSYTSYDSGATARIFINGNPATGTSPVTINQTKLPDDFITLHGEHAIRWEILAEDVALTAGQTLTVQLTGSTTGFLTADAVRVDRLVSNEYVYDNNGNLTSSIDTLDRVTNFAYDEINRQTSAMLPDPDDGGILGRPETKTTFDGFGNVVATIQTRGPATTSDDRTDKFEFDKRNRLFRQTLDVGFENLVAEFEYDAAGNQTMATDPLGNRTHFRYDKADRLVDHYQDFGDGFTGTEITKIPPALQPYGTLDGASGVTSGTPVVAADGSSVTLSGNSWKWMPLNYAIRHNTVLELEFQADGKADLYMIGVDADNSFFNGGAEEFFELAGFLSIPTIFNAEFRVEKLPNGFVRIHIPIGQYMPFDELQSGSANPTQLVFVNHDARPGLEAADRGSSTFRNIRLYDSDEIRTVTTYDTRGNVESVRVASDPRNIKNSYRHDLLGQRTHEILDDGGPQSRVIVTEYDLVGNVLAVRDDTVSTEITNQYDSLYRLITTTLPDPDGNAATFNGLVTRFRYDAAGSLIATTNGEGERSYTDYNAMGQAVAEVDGIGSETQYQYDSGGNLISVVDPKQNRTTYGYDKLDRVTRETNVSLNLSRYSYYDKQGNVQYFVDRNNRIREFRYDTLDRKVRELWYDSTLGWIDQLEWRHDELGRVTYQRDGQMVDTFAYDGLGRIVERTNYDPNLPPAANSAPEIRQVYDYAFVYMATAAAFREEVTRTQYARTPQNGAVPIGKTKSEFDRRGRLAFQYDADADPLDDNGPDVADKLVSFRYDAAGNLASITRQADYRDGIWGATTASNYRFDKANRVMSITHDLVTTDIVHSYAYDNASRVTSFNTTGSWSTSRGYVYDDAGQLRTKTGDSAESYLYDNNGNRDLVTNSVGAGQDYVAGLANRLTSDGTYNYTYDNEGNLTRRTPLQNVDWANPVVRYAYDHRNRLISVNSYASVTDANVGTNAFDTINYAYDAADGRVKRTHDPDVAGAGMPMTSQYFVYDGDDLAMAFDGTQQLTNRYLYGIGVDQVLVDEVFAAEPGHLSEAILWLLGDHQGTVRDIADDSAILRKHVEFDSFGNVTDEVYSGGSGGPGFPGPIVDQLFYWQGLMRDSTTGFHRADHRDYDPVTGRWMSEDPSGLDGGDPNLYRYVGNSPLNGTDPTGLRQAGNPLYNLPLFGSGGYSNWNSAASSNLSSQVANIAPTPVVNQARIDSLTADVARYQAQLNNVQNQLTATKQSLVDRSWYEFVDKRSDRNQIAQLKDQLPEAFGRLRIAQDNLRFAMEGTNEVHTWTGTQYVSVAGAVGSGLQTGGKAVVNAAGSTVSVGFYEGPFEVTQQDIYNGYNTSRLIAGLSGEILVGVGTGGIATYAKAGTAARYFGKTALAFDTASNVIGVGRGAVDIYENGIGLGNSAQIAGSAFGLGGNYFAGGQALSELVSDASRLQVQPAGVYSGVPIPRVYLAPQELRISASAYPELAENIRHAQAVGHPAVLTHGGNVGANRSAALKDVPQISGFSRDEYPFASAMEGGASAWVGHVPLSQQHAQGAIIANFISKNDIRPGDQYRVIIDP